jgi:hypothetical protein
MAYSLTTQHPALVEKPQPTVDMKMHEHERRYGRHRVEAGVPPMICSTTYLINGNTAADLDKHLALYLSQVGLSRGINEFQGASERHFQLVY